MNPLVQTRLAAAARRFLAAEPWTFVGDDYLFGLHDRTAGRFGCAAVLGAAGMEFGLDVSFDEKGFALLQKLQDSLIDFSTMKAKASSVTFSITDVAPASRAHRRLEPLMIDKKKVTAPARGYLTGWRLVPGQPPRALDSEEGLFLARCLEAVAELAETARLGKDPVRDGTRTLFYNLTEDEGKLTLRKSYRRLDEVDVQHAKVTPPIELMDRLKKARRVDGRYLLSMFTPPATVQDGIVWMALLLDEQHRPVLAYAAHTFEKAALSVFEAFAGATTVPGADVGVPRELWCEGFPTYEALKDALLELEIRVVSREEIPELAAARESLTEHLTDR